MNSEPLRAYLAGHTVFAGFRDDQLDTLTAHATEQAFPRGAILFTQDQDADSFFIVREGRILVEIPSLYGPPLEVQTLGADEVLGWSWLIPPYKWTFAAKAEQDSRVLVFDGKALLDRCEANPEFGYALMKRFAGLMSERLHAARLKMMESWAAPGFA